MSRRGWCTHHPQDRPPAGREQSMKAHNRADLELLRTAGLAALHPPRPRLAVGMATCGLATGAGEVYAALHEEVHRRELDVALVATGCLGYCQQEPLVDVRLGDGRRVLYSRVSVRGARDLVSALAEGRLPAEGALATIEEQTSEQTSEVRPKAVV